MDEGPNVDLAPKHAYFWKEIEDDYYDVVNIRPSAGAHRILLAYYE
jgi:hypothetical protein